MRKFCTVILLCLCFFAASAQLSEDFSDGNFSSSPSWEGDTQSWHVDEQLRLNTKDTSVSQAVYLSTPAPNSKNAKWEFLLQMNFNPSSSNRFKIYLFSDRPGLKGPLNGYFLQIGESGSADGYDLYRQDSLSSTCILRGRDVERVTSDTLRCRFRIIRDQWGNWELLTDSSGGRQFTTYGKVVDAAYPGTDPAGSGQAGPAGKVPEKAGRKAFFGMVAAYTATRSGKFFFDDLLITVPEPGSVTPPFIPEREDIIITEVYADPAPARALPEAEYFELYNTADTVIYLRNWTWKDEHVRSAFGNDSIAPGGYLVVCHREDTALFSGYGPSAGISPFPSLNNTGDKLRLISPYGMIVDSLNYRDVWYREAEKTKGGWSLERIAFSLPCYPEANWAASADPAGGTPGKPNSLAGSFLNKPFILRHFKIRDSLRLELTFSAFPETASALDPGNYLLNNGAAVQAVEFGENKQSVVLHLEEVLQRGKLYRLSPDAVSDCYGNFLKSGQYREFILPQVAQAFDVVINELLFNPRPDGADFAEIYNRSDKILDLSDFRLATLGPGSDSLESVSVVADSTLLFYPGEYRLLSRFPEKVKKQYFTRNPGAFLKMKKFPAFNNESGNCILLSGGLIMDRFQYNEEMHFELIVDQEGVSLEKTHFDLPAAQPGAFRSAASTAGYGTPGYSNSQFTHAMEGGREITLSSRIFSPDKDGVDDLLRINYRFPESNLVGSLRIFDIQGRMVKTLASNRLLGTSGSFTWDGKSGSGADLRIGIYLVYMEVFSNQGWTTHFKKTCVLARKI